jgi:hypothetical protein
MARLPGAAAGGGRLRTGPDVEQNLSMSWSRMTLSGRPSGPGREALGAVSSYDCFEVGGCGRGAHGGDSTVSRAESRVGSWSVEVESDRAGKGNRCSFGERPSLLSVTFDSRPRPDLDLDSRPQTSMPLTHTNVLFFAGLYEDLELWYQDPVGGGRRPDGGGGDRERTAGEAAIRCRRHQRGPGEVGGLRRAGDSGRVRAGHHAAPQRLLQLTADHQAGKPVAFICHAAGPISGT